MFEKTFKALLILCIFWNLFIIKSMASCMTFQGVTLCDSGDRQTQMGGFQYTTKDNQLSMRSCTDQLGYYLPHCNSYGDQYNGLSSIYSQDYNYFYSPFYWLPPAANANK